MSARLSLPRSVALVAAAVALASCSRDLTTLEPAPFPNDPGVLVDGFPAGLQYQPFAGASLEALSVDNTVSFRGNASIKISVPGPGSYAGGAFVAEVPRDLREYDALTFWARASIPGALLNTAGLGNDNTGTSKFVAERNAIPLSTSWTKIVIPIPLSARLSREAGMFFFAEGPEGPAGDSPYDFWIDELQYERLGTLRNPRPVIATRTVAGEVGSTVSVTGTAVTYDVDGADVTVAASSGYFTYASSNPAVATIADDGAITVVGAGTATITASLGETAAAGTVTLNASAPPAVAAEAPTRDAADVISLFSDSYTNRPVATFSADFDNADVADVQIAGNNVKKYTNLTFAGIETGVANVVNATEMTHVHLDIFTADASRFLLRIVDFGGNGAFGGGDDSNGQVILNTGTSPAVTAGQWTSLDIPLSAFGGLGNKAHIAQFIIENASPTLYIDNLYFYKVPVPTAPTEPAPAPTRAPGSVISLFSNAYTDVPVNTWSADFDVANLEDLQINGDDVKKYSGVEFIGIEFKDANAIDATGMTNLSMDIWTASPSAPPAFFRVVLVDAGADGVLGGGDDKEHVLDLNSTTTPALGTGSWVHLDIPLADFTGLTTRGHLSQIILAGTLGTFWLDNVYFYTNVVPAAPTAPAVEPTFDAADVISLFSNAYADVPVNTWSAGFDVADLEDIQIGGNDVKKYSNVEFIGIEFLGPNAVDARAMTHFSLDLWTATSTELPAFFRVVLVDAGADGVVGAGGDDKEHVLDLRANTTPAIGTGQWVRLDIPLATFTGLTTREHLSQIIIAGSLGTFFIDNVIFHK